MYDFYLSSKFQPARWYFRYETAYFSKFGHHLEINIPITETWFLYQNWWVYRDKILIRSPPPNQFNDCIIEYFYFRSLNKCYMLSNYVYVAPPKYFERFWQLHAIKKLMTSSV